MFTETESHYRHLFDNVPIGLYHFTADWRIIDANPTLVFMLGYPDKESLFSVRLNDIYADVRVLKDWQVELEREGVLPAYEAQYRRYDGSLIWVENHGRVVRDPESADVVCYEGSIQDITARKHEQEVLRASREHLALAQRAAGIGSFEWNLRTGVAIFSSELESLYGATFKSADNQYEAWLKYIHPDDLPVVRQSMEEALLTGDLDSEFRVVRPDGAVRWMRGIGKVLYDNAGRPERLIGINMDVTERKQAEEHLLRIESAVEGTSDGVRISDAEGNSLYHNPAFVRMFGYAPEELNAKGGLAALFVSRETAAEVQADGPSGLSWRGEVQLVGQEGQHITADITRDAIRDERGRGIGMIGIYTDVTEHRKLEEQFRQSQKMEAVGRLAAGVAHDFNNLITAINGYSDLSLRRLRPDDPLHHNLSEIKRAGERATMLTRQLLAFSRKQVLQPKMLNLNSLITDMIKMLGRMVGEDVELLTKLNAQLGQVRTDPGQLEQVIVNLAVNARDAMPQGGKLIIETSNVMMDEAIRRQYPSVRKGPHVLLAVSDTGHGMSRETQGRVFEPFFTTKEVGKGTGLGLSTVYGIVKQSDGYISVYSEEGRGTTFRVYLPRVDERAEATEAAPQAPEFPVGGETVLLVEDEDLVRGIAQTTLEMSGYKVLTAANAGEALLICEQEELHIGLLLTDVVMPKMSGQELVKRLGGLRPEMKILFMSGYTEDAIKHHGVLEEGTAFIEKPFTPDALAQKVREVLNNS